MPTENKSKIINELEDTMAKSKVIILAEYRGMKATQLSGLRRKLKGSESEIRVVKNTLARLAAIRSGKEALVSAIEGPIAITFGFGDVAAPARVFTGNQADLEGLVIKGGFLGGKMYSRNDILSLAALPSREVLLGRVLGQMNAPVSHLVGALTSPLRGIMGILQARIKQLEEKQ